MITSVILFALFMYTAYRINECFSESDPNSACKYSKQVFGAIDKWLNGNIFITMMLAIIMGIYTMKVTI